MRYALVEDGVVTNVIVADAGYVAPVGQAVAVDDTVAAGIGWTYADGVFSAPEPPPPQPVVFPALTARQFWLAALDIGVSEAGLAAAIADPDDALYIADEGERAASLIDITKATSFTRDYPLVEAMATAHGITPQQMDDLWLWAAQIE